MHDTSLIAFEALLLAFFLVDVGTESLFTPCEVEVTEFCVFPLLAADHADAQRLLESALVYFELHSSYNFPFL